MPILGIDIGGSKVRAAVFERGRVLRAVEWKTPRTLRGFARKLSGFAETCSEAQAAGVGAAGSVRGTTVISSNNIPYLKNFDFRTAFRKIPIRLDNDARAFLRGEYAALKKKPQRAFGLTLGTGIGRALIETGRIKKLKAFEYPEPWEPLYQKLRWPEDRRSIIELFAAYLFRIDRKFKPQIVIVGGGFLKHRGFFEALARESRRRGLRSALRRAALGKYSAAVGAALLFEKTQ